MRTKTGNSIFKVLLQHHGRDQAISAPDICRALHLPVSKERQIRRIIADENALWPEVLICATPGAGYFCAATYPEMLIYDNWLRQLVTKHTEKLRVFRATAKQLGFNIAALPPMAIAA